MTRRSSLKQVIARFCDAPQVATALPGVRLYRSQTPTEPMPVVYEPMLCVIAQGRKRVLVGQRVYVYDAATYLIASVDLPATGAVVEASPARPYLALSLAIRREAVASLLLEAEVMAAGAGAQAAQDGASVSAVAVSPLRADLLDAVRRMVGLLETPQEIPVLFPLIEREILYRLLRGPQGGLLRQIALGESRAGQIGWAIRWLRERYREPFAIDQVAAEARMSASSLHRHFKAMTGLSPLQYQKRLRLQAARQRLLDQAADAATVGLEVGYDSASQFSREYRRLFGAPPARDAARLRRVAQARV